MQTGPSARANIDTGLTARTPIVAVFLISAFFFLILAGCASKPEPSVEPEDIPADEILEEALRLRHGGEFTAAIKKFEEVDRFYPYSAHARKALINLAYLSYRSGRFDDSINYAKRFLILYPSHDDSPYALYLIGNSHFQQIPDISRDQGPTRDALQAFTELVARAPDSEYADDARAKIRMTQDQLAGKEMQVGRYYSQRGDHLAAVNRYRLVVEKYQTTRHIEEALFRLTEAYYALGILDEAQTAAAILGHNYPESQWYKDAYDLLKSGGYEDDPGRKNWLTQFLSGN